MGVVRLNAKGRVHCANSNALRWPVSQRREDVFYDSFEPRTRFHSNRSMKPRGSTSTCTVIPMMAAAPTCAVAKTASSGEMCLIEAACAARVIADSLRASFPGPDGA